MYTCIHSKFPVYINQYFFIFHILLTAYIEEELVDHELSREKVGVYSYSFTSLCVVQLSNSYTRTLNVLILVGLYCFMMQTKLNKMNTQRTTDSVEPYTSLLAFQRTSFSIALLLYLLISCRVFPDIPLQSVESLHRL